MERAFIEFYDKFSISYNVVSKIIIAPEMEPRLCSEIYTMTHELPNMCSV